MKVKELIQLLKDEDQDKTVRFGHDYGDYNHTTITPEIVSVEQHTVVFIGYFSDFALVEKDEGDEYDDSIVLSV